MSAIARERALGQPIGRRPVNAFRLFLRRGFIAVEGTFDRVFGSAWNPFYHLGALGWLYFWIVTVSGVYLFIFFDTGIAAAYRSVERITHEQWYAGGIMRSLHRYASDALVVMIVIHMAREFAFDRYRGSRWYSWVTGVPILWFVFAAGITGYWMVWDKLAQYVAIGTTEWLDWLPIFGDPTARNFLSPAHLNDRFFTLMIFLHIAVPLIMLFVMWFHLQRVSHARVNPPLGLGLGTMAMLLVLSVVAPAISHEGADLAAVPTELRLDWFYLWVFPLIEHSSAGAVWVGLVGGSVLLMALPWLSPRRRRPTVVVHLDNCNGCSRCANDCPFNAITMRPRSDGSPFEHEAVVDANLCLSCGICAGACPTATPFRRGSALVPGIELPDRTVAMLRDQVEGAVRGLQGRRVLVFGCDHASDVTALKGAETAAVSLPCIAALPPSFVDYVLSRNLAEGVFVTGCRKGEGYHRLGVRWTEERFAGLRDPYLRARVPRERLATFWAAPTELHKLRGALAAFAERLEGLPRAPVPGAHLPGGSVSAVQKPKVPV